ncbi:uncharacterized protein (TIGR02646 family) [Enterococcus rotai]|uniref:TIGR02646 family protein n=1 Tax=Enterococcus rotai TaxID=118060 RepID=A0A0U2MXF4_9ENTE|nr:retron system putative HNH endonuclease [Enterococcus rotai]ALS37459.1 hypothetical protein ATZ35_09945 [Enterococcus rotai]
MLYIEKGREPNSLVGYKKQKDASYRNLDSSVKIDIKNSLLKEQGYLCAYCMSRISLDGTSGDKMTIEHFHPISDFPNLQLDYNNLLAVCSGGSDREKDKSLTCDKHKCNNYLVHIDPQKRNTVEKIKYKTDGIIFSDDEDVKTELNTVLNLNCSDSMLVSSRNNVKEELIKFFTKSYPRRWTKMDILKIKNRLLTPDKNGKLTPYIGIVLYKLNRK